MDHKTKEVMEIVKGKLGYFKKLITVVLIVLLLIGCTSDGLDDTPKDDNESNVVTEKEASEYVYVHQQDEYDLKSLMNESGLSSEFEMSFKFESEFDLPKIQRDRMFENEEIYIDLDSEDANKIQNMLKDSYTENVAIRASERKKYLKKLQHSNSMHNICMRHIKQTIPYHLLCITQEQDTQVRAVMV